jgi:glycosyltransferase involved in cell wall biosynthesis
MVTVAIPVFNGAQWLPGVLRAVAEQRLDREIELLVSDSGSVDGSREIARRAGARVLDIAPGTFHHAGTRNLLMEQARGEFVAMITQDAEPAGPYWLDHLMSGFALGEDVALVYGPYLPRPDCPWRDAARLQLFFANLSPDGRPRVDRLAPAERNRETIRLLGARGYFTDANGCIRRAAWQQIPYPSAAHAEDHALAVKMLNAGYAKAYVPAAGVLHSHRYTPGQRLRRAFDDWRGLREVYGWHEPATLGHITLQLRGAVANAHRARAAAGVPAYREPAALVAAAGEHALHLAGAILGSRADRLPDRVRRRISLERRAGFAPLGAALTAAAPAPVTGADRRAPDGLPRTPSERAGDGSAWR